MVQNPDLSDNTLQMGCWLNPFKKYLSTYYVAKSVSGARGKPVGMSVVLMKLTFYKGDKY